VIGNVRVWVGPPTPGQVDIACLVDRVAIHYGRDDTNSQPDASSCTVDLSFNTDETPYPDIEIGYLLVITEVFNGTIYNRFRGTITDQTTTWDDADENTPNHLSVQIIGTDPLAGMGRRVIGDVPFPQELDGARMQRIFTAAGVNWNPNFSDPGTVQILTRDIDSQPALDVARGTADSAGGIVWADTLGTIFYADANHRRNTVSALTLDACDILVTPQWARTTAGLINKVSIGYGVAPDGGEQPRYIAQNDPSIARFGRYEFTAETELAAQADATAMGQLLLVRNSSPVWVMDTLPVDVEGLDAPRTATLLGLQMHSLITLTGLPGAGSAPTSAVLWVEGWSETYEYGVHELDLSVSGYCRTSPPPRWDDVAPTTTWDAAPGTWDDATCFGPQPSLGRWDDVSASVRWNTITPNTITWDTWPG
jgi:hypothetical protein